MKFFILGDSWGVGEWTKKSGIFESIFTPPKNTFFSWGKIKRILDHYNVNEKEFIIDNINQLDCAKVIQQLATESPLFPDNGHPGRECFEKWPTD